MIQQREIFLKIIVNHMTKILQLNPLQYYNIPKRKKNSLLLQQQQPLIQTAREKHTDGPRSPSPPGISQHREAKYIRRQAGMLA